MVLARTMVGIGHSHGTRVTAMLTDMSQPLGRTVGNALEIRESIDVLKGQGPPDVTELTLRFATEMLVLGRGDEAATARTSVESAVGSGRALDVLGRLIVAQGGDPSCLDDPTNLPRVATQHVIEADRDGYIATCDALAIGEASVRLGAGRMRKDDTIDPAVGFIVEARVGDRVERGQPLARVVYRERSRLDAAMGVLQGAWVITDEPVKETELIMDVVT